MEGCTGEFRTEGQNLMLWNHPWFYTNGTECNKCGRVYHTSGKLAGKPAFTWGYPTPVYLKERFGGFVNAYGDEIKPETLIRYPPRGEGA